MEKKNLGQFYTTNYNYILQNLFIPENTITIIEPFCGSGELLKFIDDNKFKIETFDIDPKIKVSEKRDTLLNPPSYKDKFILTNPPYLARNKCKEKKIFDFYNVNDLYKCFIKELLMNQCQGGIIIIPLNFWSSIRKNDIELRILFLQQYNVLQLNIFEENVFDDTSYTVCSFQFEKRTEKTNNFLLPITVYPCHKKIQTELNQQNNYIIGGDIYNIPVKNNYKIYRLTSKNKNEKHSNIMIKCIDDNGQNRIQFQLVENESIYIDETPNQTARTYATMIIEPFISIDQQKKIVEKANQILNEHREKYHSLFLTNYRESKDIARKRISFDLAYRIIEHVLDEMY
jgi:hypothetical protein